MTTIRGVYVARVLDVILDQSAYPSDTRYDLWEDLRLFAQNNFDEYLTYVLRYYADSVLPEYVRYDIVVRSNGFNRPASYTINEQSEDLDYFKTGDVIFRSSRYNFSFRFGMPAMDIFHGPYELKIFLDSIKDMFFHHATHATEADSRTVHRARWDTRESIANGFGVDFDTLGITRDNTRARELLLSQCTESQVREYEKHRYITVYGGITGNKYRIRHAYQINVDVMDRDRVMYKLCTVADPELNQGMPVEDNMLAQKTMIELNEQEFLQIAIRW